MKGKADISLALVPAFIFLLLLVISLTIREVRAESIISCPQGMKYESDLCFESCREGYLESGPTCRRDCNKGYKWNGVACSNWWYNYVPESYIRNTSSPTVCSSTSFTRDLPAVTNDAFSMIIASDIQYPWWRGTVNPTLALQKGDETNRQQVRAMNNIASITHTVNGETMTGQWPDNANVPEARRSAAIIAPDSVVVNGDLTAFWHDWQVDKYMDLFHRNDATPDDQENLKLDMLPGLGNHDYENNANNCWWSRNLEYLVYGNDGCAKNAAHYIKKMINCNLVSNFPASSITAFHESSLAYSWSKGKYHFIQLHNYPTYSYNDAGITSSITWLRGELNRAHNAGRRIVLMLHNYTTNNELLEAMAGKNVVAIFSGHIHSSHGYVGHVYDRPEIPVFRSGASEYNTFLLVEFAESHMTVGTVRSYDGTPEFISPADNRYMRTIEFSASSE